jgi:hypothetical protein
MQLFHTGSDGAGSAGTRAAASGGLWSPPERDDVRPTPHGETPFEGQELLSSLPHRICT